MKEEGRPPMPIQVERIEQPTREQFQSLYVASCKPVIITGAMKEWKALSLWSTEYLKAVMGKTRTSVLVTRRGKPLIDSEKGFIGGKNRVMDVDDYIDLITSPNSSSETYYLQQKSIPRLFPALSQDIECPPYFDKSSLKTINLWFGQAGNVTSLHYDTSHNLLAQVSGKKRVMLFPSNQLSSLYPFSVHSKMAHISKVDIDRPDYGRFPKARKAASAEALLGPGEMLFIPVFWWHQVYSLDLAISVNFWWKAPAREWLKRSGLRMIYRRQVYRPLHKVFLKARPHSS